MDLGTLAFSAEPTLSQGETFEEGFVHRIVRDQGNLKEESPNNKQLVEIIQFCHLRISFQL